MSPSRAAVVPKSLLFAYPQFANAPYCLPCGPVKPEGNGFSSVADWHGNGRFPGMQAKLLLVKNTVAFLAKAVPGYWKFVAGLIPKYTPAPPRTTVFGLKA